MRIFIRVNQPLNAMAWKPLFSLGRNGDIFDFLIAAGASRFNNFSSVTPAANEKKSRSAPNESEANIFYELRWQIVVSCVGHPSLPRQEVSGSGCARVVGTRAEWEVERATLHFITPSQAPTALSARASRHLLSSTLKWIHSTFSTWECHKEREKGNKAIFCWCILL